MKDAIVEEAVVADKPKTKKGTKTEVEGAEPKEKKTRSAPKSKTGTFRLISGVDPTAFRGQRQIVVKALISLGEGSFTAADIAAKTEGLVSKTPIEASTLYHLRGLVDDGKAEFTPSAEPVVEKVAA
jgi:hypothetical protein